MKKQEEILADPVEKLKLLLEQGEFELLEEKTEGRISYRLIYLMNDAVESFLVLKNCRMTGCLILDTVDGPALFLGHLLAGGTGLHGINRVLGAALAAGGQSGGDGQQQEQTDSALNDVLHDFLHSPAPIAGRFSTLIHYHTTEIK